MKNTLLLFVILLLCSCSSTLVKTEKSIYKVKIETISSSEVYGEVFSDKGVIKFVSDVTSETFRNPFPFLEGDTILRECTLNTHKASNESIYHTVEVSFSDYETMRTWVIVVIFILIVFIFLNLLV